jgi:hypothetical protein
MDKIITQIVMKKSTICFQHYDVYNHLVKFIIGIQLVFGEQKR